MKFNIQNLRDGNYSFEFTKESSELDFDNIAAVPGSLRIRAEVEKREKNIFILTWVDTQASFVCDKCLQGFTQDITNEFRTLYTSDKDLSVYEDDDMVELLTPHTREIDLATGVRDSLMMALPMKTVCSEDCQGLCAGCGMNLNKGRCKCVHSTVDPRWEGLRKLLD